MNKDLEKGADRTRREFVYIASHQLRTPLTAIKWLLELFIANEKPTEQGKIYLDRMRVALAQLINFTEVLLNASRIEAGKIAITAKPLEVVNFTREYLDESMLLFMEKGVSLVFEKHPSVLNAVTDEVALRNIMHSVITNAIEYTAKGGRVEVSLSQKNQTFLFTVSDTGIGIPKEEQATIFDKFTRGSNAKRIKNDGTGLGLYTAAQTVKFLGGKIWFESEKDKGSTFYIKLPLKSKLRHV